MWKYEIRVSDLENRYKDGAACFCIIIPKSPFPFKYRLGKWQQFPQNTTAWLWELLLQNRDMKKKLLFWLELYWKNDNTLRIFALLWIARKTRWSSQVWIMISLLRHGTTNWICLLSLYSTQFLVNNNK